MKCVRNVVLIASLLLAPSVPADDSMKEQQQAEENLWRSGSGAHDGARTAIATSMIGWGVGLAVAIALLAATLNHGSGGSSHAHSCQ